MRKLYILGTTYLVYCSFRHFNTYVPPRNDAPLFGQLLANESTLSARESPTDKARL